MNAENAAENDRKSSGAHHRFNNELRYRDDDHEMQRQLTPGYVLEPVREALGGIALDPCTEPDNPTGAYSFYTAEHDGAVASWQGYPTIYVNPPYSKARERWVLRCIGAASLGARVVLLMPSHTDTRLFHLATETASHVVFIKGRVKFGVLRENGRQEAASHPSCLIAWNLPSAGPMASLGRVWDLRAETNPRHIGCARRVESGWIKYACGVDVPVGTPDAYADHVRASDLRARDEAARLTPEDIAALNAIEPDDVPCPNEHGADGVIACWSPGGPCPEVQAVCESCGPCNLCRPGEHPINPPGSPDGG